MELLSDFAKDVEKIAKDMRQYAKKSKDAPYLLNTATRLERLADSYKETAWEISMGEDL